MPWSSFQADSDDEAEAAKSTQVAVETPKNKTFGGFIKQTADPEVHKNPPAKVIEHQMTATCADYQAAAIRDGIAFREAGLFPPDDPVIQALVDTEGLYPFEKHLPGENEKCEALTKGSWVSGNESAEHGFDLRLFYKRKGKGDMHGQVSGALRLGDKAAIGNGFWMSAHGGAIESALDETTAELGKLEFAPLLSTIEATFKLKKAVPLHTSLNISAKIAKTQGFRVWVNGTITEPETNTMLASCEAQLVNLQPILAAKLQAKR